MHDHFDLIDPDPDPDPTESVVPVADDRLVRRDEDEDDPDGGGDSEAGEAASESAPSVCLTSDLRRIENIVKMLRCFGVSAEPAAPKIVTKGLEDERERASRTERDEELVRTFFSLDGEAPRARLERIFEARLEDLPGKRVLRARRSRVAASPLRVYAEGRHARGTRAWPFRRGCRAGARLGERGRG